ncbi:MAG: signal peptidase I [Lachnospiraceae bacterium]|nr:signal peptidase I [Lachnospiraceae bacterium]
MKVKDIVSKIINVISVLIIALAVVILVSVLFTKSGQVPRVGGFSFFRVVTGSMEPEIGTGSFIVVKETDPAQIQQGDVISFYSSAIDMDGAVNTHRVVSVTEENGEYFFETRGDANALPDKELTPGDQVIGKVIAHSNVLGKLVGLLINPLIFFPLIVLPLVILIIVNLISSVRHTKALMQEEEEAAIREAIEAYKRKKAEGDDADSESEEPHNTESAADTPSDTHQ